MGHRIKQEREQRTTSLLPVRIRGCDTKGNQVSQVACTLNVSHVGARLVGLAHRLKVGSIVWLRCHQEEGRYRVVWAGRDGKHWQAGVRSLESGERLWGVELGCGLEAEDCRRMLKQVLEKFWKALGKLRECDRELSIPDLGRQLVATLVIFRRLCFACRLEPVESWLIKSHG